MRTSPTSLRHRVTFAGVALVAVVVLALDVFVYLALRDRMLSELDRVLEARAQLVQGLSADLQPLPLAARLQELGVRSIVRTPDGDEHRSGGAPPFEQIPAGGEDGDLLAARHVHLSEGVEVVVLASRGGIDATLRRLLVLEVVGTVAAVVVAAVVLWRVSGRVLRPVADVARTARDITEGDLSRRLEAHDQDDELGEMVAAFNDMLDALEHSLERTRSSELASRRFLADAAHQLRTPAAGIRASVATVLRTDSPVEREQLLDNLAAETARMSRLLSSLLRVARLDAGEPGTRAPVDVAALVRSVVDRRRARYPSVNFEIAAGDRVEAVVDVQAIEEALDNLVDNACRFARTTVEVEVEGREDEARIVVDDDGPGIAVADRERVFARFVSLDGAGGSGLGLPIARGIAEAHGGELHATDEGFVLRLPRRSLKVP